MATSTAAAMALGLVRGRFHRGASTGCLNLLQVYEEGCPSNCTYCGLARQRVEPPSGRTFIRVPWPQYPVEVLAARARERRGALRRVCVGMFTHPRALAEAVEEVAFFCRETRLPVSVLMSATLFRQREDVEAMRAAGADGGTVAIDAATPELFARHRGRATGSPHDWDQSGRVTRWCVEVFGPGQAGLHLIAGLGETERETAQCIQRAHDLGAVTHLFSFYPEAGSRLADAEPPPVGHYRPGSP